MKLMKQIITSLTALLLLASVSANAQYRTGRRPATARPKAPSGHYDNRGSRYNGYTYYGFRVGLNASNISSDSKFLDGNKMATGLNLGFAIGTSLSYSSPIFLESGLYYTEKGGKSEKGLDKFTYDLNYLEVPIVFKYRYFVDRDCSIDPFLGGYLALGVGGEIKDYAARASYGSFSDTYLEHFKRFDAGIKVGCGMTANIFYGEISYDIGLADVGSDSFGDTRTGCLNFLVGVNF